MAFKLNGFVVYLRSLANQSLAPFDLVLLLIFLYKFFSLLPLLVKYILLVNLPLEHL